MPPADSSPANRAAVSRQENWRTALANSLESPDWLSGPWRGRSSRTAPGDVGSWQRFAAKKATKYYVGQRLFGYTEI